MIVDASALLAVLFGEPRGAAVAAVLDAHGGELAMSTVNLAEVAIRVRDRVPDRADQVLAEVQSRVELVPPDTAQALLAADARLRFPLHLGDCFAYALAKTRGEPLLTLDNDFADVDCELVAV